MLWRYRFQKILHPVLICLLHFTSVVYTQSKFENFNLRDGLPSNKIYCSLKDARGFLWFGTGNGLCRFDGIRFSTFKSDSSNNHSLPENVVTFLYQLNQDRILVITLSGSVYYYDYSTGQFDDLADNHPWMRKYSISNYFHDSNNFNWFTTDRGIIKASGSFNFIKEYIIPEKVKGHEFANKVNLICEDKNGLFWLGMFYRGLVLFDPVKGSFDTKTSSSFIPHVQIESITTKRKSDYVYAAVTGEGIYKINIKDFSFKKWDENNSALLSNLVSELCFENDSILWAGTNSGLSKINIANSTFVNYVNVADNPNSIVNNIIFDLFIDDQRILWISTFGGLSKLNLRTERFKKLLSDNSSSNCLLSNKIAGCFVDKFQNIWIATSEGLNIFTPDLLRCASYILPKSHKFHTNNDLVCIYEDNKNNIWIGTWGGGISRTKLHEHFSPGDRLIFSNFYYDSLDVHSLSSNFIRWFSEDDEGNLWISTWNGGMNKIGNERKSSRKIMFERLKENNDPSKGLASNYIGHFVRDDNSNFWLATGSGVQQYNFKDSKFTLYMPGRGGINNLINSSSFLLYDNKKDILSGGFGGLVRFFNTGKDKYSSEIIFEDANRGIYSMKADNQGKVWFTTQNSEVGCYEPGSNDIKFYSMIEEVNGCDFYSGFPAMNKEGVIFFPSFSGLLYFNPKSVYTNQKIPPVAITKILVAGNELQKHCDVSLLKEIELDYTDANISIFAASLNYLLPQNNNYKYMLAGYQDKWINLGRKSEIHFAGLSPGRYELKILGSNNDGIWNDKPAVLVIAINPPFYLNTFFISVTAGLLILMTVYTVNKRIRHLKKEKAQHHMFSRQLIELQEEERKRISSELHDSLGQNLLVIKNLLYLYRNSDSKNEDDLEQVSGLIKESIDEIKELSTNLHPHQLEKLGLIKAISSMIAKVERASGIKIVSELHDIAQSVPSEYKINIYRIIQEALNNVVKHSNAANASVKIITSGNSIVIEIKDDGRGIDFSDAAVQSNLVEGFGLKSLKERARLISGELTINSSLNSGTQIKILIAVN